MLEIRETFPMSDWPRMLAFIKERYRPDIAVASREFFDWQFRIGTDGNSPILSAWDEGELQGILGYLRWPVFWGAPDQTLDSVWTLYWMVRPEAPKGLGWLLHRKLMERFPVALSVNTSAQGGPLLSAMGWTLEARVPRRLFVFDAEACAPLLGPESSRDALSPFLCAPKTVEVSDTDAAVDGNSYRPDWTLYFERAFGTVRSLDYLRWRYLSHPFFEYRVELRGAPERPAVCVFRVERIFGAAQGLAGRIVDLYHPLDEQGRLDGRAALGAALSELKSAGCAFADFVGSHDAFNATAQEAGGNEEPVERQILPSRLTPLQHLRREQNLAWFASKGLERPALGLIHCTRSDIDGDGPASLNLPDRRGPRMV